MMDQKSAVWLATMQHEKAKVLAAGTMDDEDEYKESMVEDTLDVASGKDNSLGIVKGLHRGEEEA
jgi:hypothetical protein